MSIRKLLNLFKKRAFRRGIFLMMVILVYVLWKAYVLQTPSPHDDDIPDKIRDAVLIMVYDDPNNAMNDVDPDTEV